MNSFKDGDAVADGNAICKLDVDHVPCFMAVVTCHFVHEASDLSTCRNSVDKYQPEQTGTTKLVLYHILVVPESTFRSCRSLFGGIRWIPTGIQWNAQPKWRVRQILTQQ
jgi:hypothetical protein